LKRLGTVLHIIDNLLIVRADKTLEKSITYQNSIVITKKLTRIGRINELFGSVSSPYYSIKLYKGIQGPEIKTLKNERIYLQ
jgi:rRNA processing protein Gar1